MSVRFGDLVLDPGTRQLRRGEEERHLGPKAFELPELPGGHRGLPRSSVMGVG